MDGLLTAIKTVKQGTDPPLATAESHSRRDASAHVVFDLDHELSPNQIINVLKSQPDHEQLSAVLVAIDPYNTSKKIDFDIRIPAPATTQILQLLVSTTIPDHWASLNATEKKSKDAKTRAALLRCLSSIPGLGSLVGQLRSLVAYVRATAQHAESSVNQIGIRDVLAVLATLLEPKEFILRIYSDISQLFGNRTRQQVAWRELVSLVAAGKILSTAAEALTLLNESDITSSLSWVGDGPRYASWLGGNISRMIAVLKTDDDNGWASIAFLTGRALSLGYADQLSGEIYSGLISDQSFSVQFNLLLDQLKQSEQVNILEATFRDIQKRHFSDDTPSGLGPSLAFAKTVAGVAALCAVIIGDRPFLKGQTMDWLIKSQGGSINTVGLRRALLALYNTDDLMTLLTRGLENFGDNFHIKQVPSIAQSANAQVILVAAGRLNRLDSSKLKVIGRSGTFLKAVSNRLAASSNISRFLGMIVGTGISELMEEPGKAMKFDLEEMQTEEANWLLDLSKVQDEPGSFDTIKALQETRSVLPQSTKDACCHPSDERDTRPNRSQKSKIVAIEEIDDSNDDTDEDEDLMPYEKPDDDADDDDEDPTLVQRNKPTAPVYIRDLITYLRDAENVERHHLAISTAPSLIRRKTGFGTELAEQIEELALTIVGLQNDNNHPQFHESRLQSMVGLVVSQPLKMGRWFSAIFFDGDLSQVQRSAVLTALGLSAREIAGNGEEDAKALGLPALKDTSFPSKQLSPALEAMFSDSKESPVAALTKQMSRTSLQPLAAHAADTLTGPDALKVRTFSSRMEVEKKRRERDAQRQKFTAKDLHKVLAEGFFYPLAGRFQIVMLQFSSSAYSSYNPFSVPHILTLFLQTLSLILTTAGPYTPFLPGFTHETLSLLLSLHTAPVSSEPSVTAALLTVFLAILDLNIASGSNGEERLVTEYATQAIELREWASQVFDRTPSGLRSRPASSVPADPQDQVRTLAAGVMVRLGEITERYQGRLMGINTGFQY
ncbi:uncharacterized protein N7459_001432 [Penicillium hispanicum]|uniref:uncharacterized protein n=1 Tax=Penicillium hispanicum TaxID=1080232 RepID=UPI0025414901|nr:uncharacterized protein N7459_001432 [Penicillium hispanicum]KAJ5595224.1 hypothetical protein N7459_001432 [Penicillium hispanicum]